MRGVFYVGREAVGEADGKILYFCANLCLSGNVEVTVWSRGIVSSKGGHVGLLTLRSHALLSAQQRPWKQTLSP
eukprot:7588756-Pyramimonas_sp.AAC.2